MNSDAFFLCARKQKISSPFCRKKLNYCMDLVNNVNLATFPFIAQLRALPYQCRSFFHLNFEFHVTSPLPLQ